MPTPLGSSPCVCCSSCLAAGAGWRQIRNTVTKESPTRTPPHSRNTLSGVLPVRPSSRTSPAHARRVDCRRVSRDRCSQWRIRERKLCRVPAPHHTAGVTDRHRSPGGIRWKLERGLQTSASVRGLGASERAGVVRLAYCVPGNSKGRDASCRVSPTPPAIGQPPPSKRSLRPATVHWQAALESPRASRRRARRPVARTGP
jgi:hypothetical protein